ncbi:N-acetylmuramoyl-L-alanine amidase family protein [Clostridium sp.]|uniref:N-acetylmuramoyl-L-alanine amidase family protein n=1 Tax=Clostridium sp. TaxID=1506 RepID=UPI002618EAE4|nr:N-acetylmuramoyl-L-alanine amidase family protein [Clostridium sp.]
MFKRANKITALLVAAASIMSVVPAMAATKLGTKDGTIEDAIAFKDGKYVYEGYRTSDDDTGLYYNAGDKDKKLDTVTAFTASTSSNGTDGVKFDDKYATAYDGSDEYIVDLSAGTVSDSDIATDLKDTAQTKLANKLKKCDRYDKDGSSAILGKKIGYNKFGDVWYEYSATTQAGVSVDAAKTAIAGLATTPQAILYGYANESGTYVDASYNANIYFYDGTTMQKIKNVGDKVNDVTLNSITPLATLGQDANYIYRVVAANLSSDGTGAGFHHVKDSSGASSSDYLANGDYNQSGDTLYYVQKIAKAQGDTEKDAYLPKTTDSYEISGATGDGDSKDAYNVVKRIIDGTDNAVSTIVDGSIYITYNESSDKVKTERVDLKTSVKLDRFDNTKTSETKLGSKVDGHVAVKNGDKDQDIADVSGKDARSSSWTVDTNGAVWAIHDGEILKSVKLGDFTTVYTCDRSFDKIDVYDDSDLIAWEDGGNAYTTVSEGTAQSAADASAIVNPTPAKVGWDKQADGTWNFYDATGAKVANNWVNVGGVWYFLKADGVMATGWQQVNGAWYFLQPSGAMATGWVNDNGTWYYLQSSGAMKTGWLNDNGTWYYLNASGAMLANTTVDGYVLGASGAWIQ